MMSAALFHFQDTLNRLFDSFIYKVISILEKFFLKYEGGGGGGGGGGGQIDPPTSTEKTTLKKPSHIRVNLG